MGKTWTGTQYRALIASYRQSDGGQDLNFALGNGWLGRMLFDFSGAGYDNLCTAVTYAYDGFIAACRSMKSSAYYDVYLVKFDNAGNLITSFGTNGIKATGLGGTNSHAFARGIAYSSAAGTLANGGVVAIVGATGTYSGGFSPCHRHLFRRV